jgi:hypothetical protein
MIEMIPLFWKRLVTRVGLHLKHWTKPVTYALVDGILSDKRPSRAGPAPTHRPKASGQMATAQGHVRALDSAFQRESMKNIRHEREKTRKHSGCGRPASQLLSRRLSKLMCADCFPSIEHASNGTVIARPRFPLGRYLTGTTLC